jgi:hypothetical protein
MYPFFTGSIVIEKIGELASLQITASFFTFAIACSNIFMAASSP